MEVKGGAADHLEHVGGRRLLLKGLPQVLVSRAELIEKPNVLDRNGCLVGKSLDKRDLLVGKCPNLKPINQYDAKKFVASHNGNAKNRPDRLDLLRPIRIFGIGLRIRNLDRAALKRGTRGAAVAARNDRVLLDPLDEFESGIIGRRPSAGLRHRSGK